MSLRVPAAEVAQEGRCDEIADAATYSPSRVLFQISDGEGAGRTEMVGPDVLEIVVAKSADDPVSKRAGELIVATYLPLSDPATTACRALRVNVGSSHGINLRAIRAVHPVATASRDVAPGPAWGRCHRRGC